MPDYSSMDHPSILRFVFYPREDVTPCPPNAFDLSVPVEEGVSIACRFYAGDREWPWILFFHGNGEVVSDYDDIAPLYHMKEINLVVVDYRGYGASTGLPTLTNLTQDAHVIFERVKQELSKRGFRSDLWVMGRSLGSASALELASRHGESIRGLVIESGSLSVARIIGHLGIPAPGVDLEGIERSAVEMVEAISIPCLLIHGEEDTLVPFSEAEDLYRRLGSKDKELIAIGSAGHNDIMAVGFREYFEALGRFVERTDQEASG